MGAFHPPQRFTAMVTRLTQPRQPERAAVPPLQEVAQNVRRLRRAFLGLPRGTSYVRTVGVATAYDEILSLACAMLEVPNRLLALRHGTARELERLRVEYELGERGLIL